MTNCDASTHPRRPTAAIQRSNVRRLPTRALPDDGTTATRLRRQFTARAAHDPRRRSMYDAICSTLDRRDRVRRPLHGELWNRFLAILEDSVDVPGRVEHLAVLANMVGIVAFGDARDYATLSHLARVLRQGRLSRAQHRCSIAMETLPSLPWTTTVARRLGAEDLQQHLLADPVTAPHAAAVVRACARAAQTLLFEGVEPTWDAPAISTVEELVAAADKGSIVEWRHHVAMVAAHPWSPYARQLLALAEQSGRAQLVTVVRVSVERCRDQWLESEKELVAREIKELVAASGATQREFAAWIGTSPSRLSTYITGSVTPSAALLLRIRRTSEAIQREREPLDPPPEG